MSIQEAYPNEANPSDRFQISSIPTPELANKESTTLEELQGFLITSGFSQKFIAEIKSNPNVQPADSPTLGRVRTLELESQEPTQTPLRIRLVQQNKERETELLKVQGSVNKFGTDSFSLVLHLARDKSIDTTKPIHAELTSGQKGETRKYKSDDRFPGDPVVALIAAMEATMLLAQYREIAAQNDVQAAAQKIGHFVVAA